VVKHKLKNQRQQQFANGGSITKQEAEEVAVVPALVYWTGRLSHEHHFLEEIISKQSLLLVLRPFLTVKHLTVLVESKRLSDRHRPPYKTYW
jgi:hypothetical protein